MKISYDKYRIYSKKIEFDVVEYDKDIHGEIKHIPSEIYPELKNMSLDEQIYHFWFFYDKVTLEEFNDENYEKNYKFASNLLNANMCREIIVKDNEIVGVMFSNPHIACNVKPMYIFDGIYLYTPSDNNGAGYKYSNKVYLTLIIKR